MNTRSQTEAEAVNIVKDASGMYRLVSLHVNAAWLTIDEARRSFRKGTRIVIQDGPVWVVHEGTGPASEEGIAR